MGIFYTTRAPGSEDVAPASSLAPQDDTIMEKGVGVQDGDEGVGDPGQDGSVSQETPAAKMVGENKYGLAGKVLAVGGDAKDTSAGKEEAKEKTDFSVVTGLGGGGDGGARIHTHANQDGKGARDKVSRSVSIFTNYNN